MKVTKKATPAEVMAMTDRQYDAWVKRATAQDIEEVMLYELKDPKSPMHAIVPTYKVEVRS